jgi:hypothetical protein
MFVIATSALGSFSWFVMAQVTNVALYTASAGSFLQTGQLMLVSATRNTQV